MSLLSLEGNSKSLEDGRDDSGTVRVHRSQSFNELTDTGTGVPGGLEHDWSIPVEAVLSSFEGLTGMCGSCRFVV